MNCNSCNNNKCGGDCQPAKYGDCSFSIESSPFDPTTWIVTNCGVSNRVKVPKYSETDTVLKTNYSDASLLYRAEAHEDVITGGQLGDLINIDDLRNVEYDSALTGTCYELIYTKYSDCGAGCVSVADKWHNWNVNSEDAKQDYLKYVRGANAYGCPVYLDVPTDTSTYWMAGWKTDGEHNEFGYFTPKEADIPKDSLGNYVVLSQDPTTKQPIVGALPLDCILKNLVGALGMNLYSTWSVIQATPGFSAEFNAVSGDFTITWNDWMSSNTRHVGTGHISGTMNWTVSFNTTNGHMEYHITSIYFDRAWWDVDAGSAGTGPIKLTLKGVSIPTGAETTLLNAYSYSGESSWSQNIGQTITCDQSVSVAPGSTVGPFNFLYIFVDWIGDDEGYLQLNFQNKIPSWSGC